MEELQEAIREKMHLKLDGGSLFSPETIAKGQEVWKELQPHVDVLRESAQLAAGSQLQTVASERLDQGLRMAGEQVRGSLCDDEHMPRWARAWVHRLMDVLWPEVHREVHSSVMLELGEKLGQYEEPWKEDDEPLLQWHDGGPPERALESARRLGTDCVGPRAARGLRQLTSPGCAPRVRRSAAALRARALPLQHLPVRPVAVADAAQPQVGRAAGRSRPPPSALAAAPALSAPAERGCRWPRAPRLGPRLDEAPPTNNRQVASCVLSVWPLYGLQPLYWILVFACIQRTDEYQLVNFILEFKALMFFSIGFVSLGIGATQAPPPPSSCRISSG